jgi:hypothetical protein
VPTPEIAGQTKGAPLVPGGLLHQQRENETTSQLPSVICTKKPSSMYVNTKYDSYIHLDVKAYITNKLSFMPINSL